MLIQVEHQEQIDVPLFVSFDEFIDELNDLLGENSYVIEQNGRKIDLASDHQLSDEHVYKIWPKVLGGKVRSISFYHTFDEDSNVFRVVSVLYCVRSVNKF